MSDEKTIIFWNAKWQDSRGSCSRSGTQEAGAIISVEDAMKTYKEIEEWIRESHNIPTPETVLVTITHILEVKPPKPRASLKAAVEAMRESTRELAGDENPYRWEELEEKDRNEALIFFATSPKRGDCSLRRTRNEPRNHSRHSCDGRTA